MSLARIYFYNLIISQHILLLFLFLVCFSSHPYIFFNPDGVTMTFLGFRIDRASGNLLDPSTKTVLESKITTTNLYDALKRQGVDLAEEFDNKQR